MRQRERLHYLDSIRGLAALTVAICHCVMMNSDEFRNAHMNFYGSLSSFSDFVFYALQKMLAGRASVMLFFVLSGFVLAYSLLKHPTTYKVYLVKRIFRIYPVFIFAVLSSFILHYFIGVQHTVDSRWLSVVIDPHLTSIVILKHLVFFGTGDGINLDNVTWSLVHEMRISLIFPLILLSVRKFKWHAVFLYSAISVASTLWFHHYTGEVVEGYMGQTFGMSLIETCFFIVFFSLGSLIAIHKDYIVIRTKLIPYPLKFLLLVFCIFCFLKTNEAPTSYLASIIDYLRGLSAAGLMILSMGTLTLEKILSHRFLLWLGKISFSLYLLHVPVLYVVNQTFGSQLSLLASSVIILLISFIVANLSVVYIETPFISLGKKLGEKFRNHVLLS